MGVHTGLQVYQAGKDYFIASGLEDAELYSRENNIDDPMKLSAGVWFSQGVFDFLKTIPLKDIKDGGILPGRGLYKVSSSDTTMFHESVPDFLVNAENPFSALEIIVGLCKRESWSFYPTYMVEMLDPGTRYTSEALGKLVSDIHKSQE